MCPGGVGAVCPGVFRVRQAGVVLRVGRVSYCASGGVVLRVVLCVGRVSGSCPAGCSGLLPELFRGCLVMFAID